MLIIGLVYSFLSGGYSCKVDLESILSDSLDAALILDHISLVLFILIVDSCHSNSSYQDLTFAGISLRRSIYCLKFYLIYRSGILSFLV